MERAYRALGRMKNIDLRTDTDQTTKQDTVHFGGRVRQMNVSRNFPGARVVIKRTHGGMSWHPIEQRAVNVSRNESAAKTLWILEERIKKHAKKTSPKDKYVLVKPEARQIGSDLVVMPKINAPTIDEILYHPTERGKKFFDSLSKRYGVTGEGLKEAAMQLLMRGDFQFGNIVVLGVRKGKFILMPLVDIF